MTRRDRIAMRRSMLKGIEEEVDNLLHANCGDKACPVAHDIWQNDNREWVGPEVMEESKSVMSDFLRWLSEMRSKANA